MFRYSLIALALLVSACAKKEEDTKPITAAALQGTWFSECLVSSDEYEKKSVEFDGVEVTMISSRYSDAACTMELDRLKGQGTYGIEAVDTSKSDITPNLVTYIFETISWTFASDPSTAEDYAAVCDSTAKEGVVDLLGKTCAISDTVTKEFSAKAYGILEIWDTKLMITDFDSNSPTAELRPKQYPSMVGFTLQVATP